MLEHLTLRETGERPRHVGPGYLAPHRLLPLAAWSSGSRVALSLNRHGEILVFNQSSLRFAFRRGKWSHFAHPAMIARMTGSDRERALIQAVYATCLDISFSRTGGCIAVEKRGKTGNHSSYLDNRDLLSLGSTEKSALVSHLVGTPFPIPSTASARRIGGLGRGNCASRRRHCSGRRCPSGFPEAVMAVVAVLPQKNYPALDWL